MDGLSSTSLDELFELLTTACLLMEWLYSPGTPQHSQVPFGARRLSQGRGKREQCCISLKLKQSWISS